MSESTRGRAHEPMVARVWRGSTAAADADAYVEYLLRTGISEYRNTPGNRGAWILRRTGAGRTDFVTLSFWDSRRAIQAFAGNDIDNAVFYPEDDRFLVTRERHVEHYDLIESSESAA